MDVQKTIEFILGQQAQSAVFQAKTEVRLDAISNLLHTGLRMLVDYQRETSTSIIALIEAQRRTDERFNLWLDAQPGGGSNGH